MKIDKSNRRVRAWSLPGRQILRQGGKFEMPTTKPPIVSVGVPVYNGERYIREALDSALKQTFADFEVIIADNNSNDATEEICRDYTTRDSRVKFIRHDENHGVHWNFRFVVQQARGRFFTWLSHDDALEPQFLERTVYYMLQNPRTVVLAVDVQNIDENGTELGIERLEGLRDSLPWEVRRFPFFAYGHTNIYHAFYGLMQTEVCKSVMASIKIPKMLGGSEYPVLARFAAAGEIASLPIVLRKYRYVSMSSFRTQKAQIATLPKWHQHWFFYSNLGKMRVDLFKVLLMSRLSPRSKFDIFRGHISVDLKWFCEIIKKCL
jgi:glycosyltransferase involved in cell wall biosynthesis